MARTSIGLDIGSRAVRLAEVQASGEGPVLTRFGRILLPGGSVDHGEVTDPYAVASAITTLWKRLGLSGRSVHVGIANRRVVVRVVDMPAMPAGDLGPAIRYQAQEHIPIPLEEAVMDHQIIEEFTNEDGSAFQRVLVVAAERATVSLLLEALKQANLEALSVELNAYPLVRCLGTATAGAEAIIDVGAGVTNVVVHHGSQIRFTRILPTFGGDEFTNAVSQAMGVERDEAESLKRRASKILRDRLRTPARAMSAPTSAAPAPSGEAEGATDDDVEADAPAYTKTPSLLQRPGLSRSGPGGRPTFGQAAEAEVQAQPSGDVDLEQAADSIEPLLDRFVTEVRGSLDFYASQPGATAVERMILTGGGALMGGIPERLSSSLGIPVEHGHPFNRVPIGRVEVTVDERAIAEPFIGVAVGLALAGMK